MASNYPRWFIDRHCVLQDVSEGMKIYVPQTTMVYNDNEMKIRKVSIGERNEESPEKVVLLVGATGSGKSTLINCMLNYIVGVKWEDDFRLKLISKETPFSQRHSQTDYITAYVIYHNTHANVPFTMTIIDTPGFGNTAGIGRDMLIADQLRTLFNAKDWHGIDELDAVGFVVPSLIPRLTPSLKYIFDSILSLFGNDIGDNIIMLLTFADSMTPQVLVGIKEAQIPYEKYFKFNSGDLYVSNKEFDDEDESFSKVLWQWGIKSLKNFVVELDKLQKRSVKQTEEVLDTRFHLETTTENLKTNINIAHETICRLANSENKAGKLDQLAPNGVYDFGATYVQIVALANDITRLMQTLTDAALRPHPLESPDYIDILITSETSEESIQHLAEARSKAVLMKKIADGTFDPFSDDRRENRNGVWTKVAKYLKLRVYFFKNEFHIDMESYKSGTHKPELCVSSKSHTSGYYTPPQLQRLDATMNLHASVASSVQSRELQDRHLLRLSERLTDRFDIRKLGNELGLERHDVSSCLTDNSQHIREAAYNVLQKWFQNQKSYFAAFEELSEALDNAGLKMLKHEVLQ